MKERLKRIATDHRTLLGLWMLLAVIGAVTKLHRCNNFLVFRGVFWHAWNGTSLYAPYPLEHNDTNYYGPLFSLLVAPFAVTPLFIGLLLWLLCLVLVLWMAVRHSQFTYRQQLFIYWFCAHELLTAIYMQQFNIAIAAIILLSYWLIEKERDFWAAFCIMLGTMVKLYGIVGLAFFFFSKHKGRLVLSLAFWAADALFFGASFYLPAEGKFWGSVIFISFFIRGLYTIVQIYAQRYVSPLSTSLIFSTEVIITMLLSPLQAMITGTVPETITPAKAAGGAMIVLGLLITEPGFMKAVRKVLAFRPAVNTAGIRRDIRRGVRLAVLSAAIYFLMDVPVQLTGLLPAHTGIKTFLPFTLGLFFGVYGAAGCCLGCIAGSLALGSWPAGVAVECAYILVTGLGMFYGWHIFSGTHIVRFLKLGYYITYLLLVLVLSALTFNAGAAASYILTGIFIALPLNILLGSLLSVEPLLPAGYSLACDADFMLRNGAESLDEANGILEQSGETHGISMKRMFEIQSLLEELSIRIFGALPDTEIHIRVNYGDAISMKLSYGGEKYDPFRISAGDDVLDITSLKIIKHRALRASFSRRGRKNHIHVVV